MNPTTPIISVREFLRAFKQLTEHATKTYLIVKHGKPIGLYTPLPAKSRMPPFAVLEKRMKEKKST